MGLAGSKRYRDRIDKFNRDPDFVRLCNQAARYEHFLSVDQSGTFHHLCESHGYKLYYTVQIDFGSKREIQKFKRAIARRMEKYITDTQRRIQIRHLSSQVPVNQDIRINEYI